MSAPRIVQIPLQLWQIPAFCREKSRSHGGTTEIGTLAFCSGSIGCPEKHENFYDFARMYSTCSSNVRKKRQAPVETATLWFGVLLFPLHMAEDTSREVLKRTFEQKSFWVFVLCFLFPHPPCPYKMTGFLPSTYKMGWSCGSLLLSRFFFFQRYNLRLFKTIWVLDTHHVCSFPNRNNNNNMITR